MKKRGEAYIDVIVGVFLTVVVLALSLNIFSFYIGYNAVAHAADELVAAAASSGETNGSVVKNRVVDMLQELGVDSLGGAQKGVNGIYDVEVSFEQVLNTDGELVSAGSDTIAGSTTGAVQRGDTVRLVITAKIDLFSYGSGSLHTGTITIYKTALSQNFFKV